MSMAEPHVVSALRAKRAEVGGYVADLERNWHAIGRALHT